MKTILHICDWYHPIGGAEKLLFDSLAMLERNGYRNIIIYNEHPHQQPTGTRPEYSVCNLQPDFSFYSPSIFLVQRTVMNRVQTIIDRHQPDVCHIHNLQNPLLVEYLIEHIPCVRSIHDPRLYCFTYWKLLPDKSVCPYPLGPECIRQGCLSRGMAMQTAFDRNAFWIYKNFRVHKKIPLLIMESRAQIERVLANGFTAEQLAWLPNFTPLEPRKKVVDYTRRLYNPAEKIVLFVGRASYEKGAQVLINAAEHIRTNCRIILITAGPLLEDFKKQSRDKKIEIIPGLSYEKTREYYARSSVVVVPSVWLENFCLVGLEAYANMKPVIGSRIGGIKDWLKDGETGYFFEPGNSRELADKIDTILADNSRLEAMGKAGYERVQQYYNADLYLKRLLDIYQKGIERFAGNRSGVAE